MVDVIDQPPTSFTITLINEGLAVIGTVTYPSSARAGKGITILAPITNDSMVADTLFARLWDVTLNAEIAGSRLSASFTAGQTQTMQWPLTMPNRNFVIRIDAGHVE